MIVKKVNNAHDTRECLGCHKGIGPGQSYLEISQMGSEPILLCVAGGCAAKFTRGYRWVTKEGKDVQG